MKGKNKKSAVHQRLDKLDGEREKNDTPLIAFSGQAGDKFEALEHYRFARAATRLMFDSKEELEKYIKGATWPVIYDNLHEKNITEVTLQR